MEPVSTIAGAWSIAKAAAEAAGKLHELAKGVKDREIRQQIHTVVDELHELKHSAALLEDENRDLREKLRFKSDDYEFRTPFWYDKAHPQRALCPKCFAQGVPAPMGEPGQGISPAYRRCLVCGEGVQISPVARQGQISPIVGRY